MTTPVEDPSKYGVVCLKLGTTQIERFVEKPQNWVGDQINAGIYIFNPKILSRIRHVTDFINDRTNQCQLKRKCFRLWPEMDNSMLRHCLDFGQM
jgi:NDP-sugar pyrophosphorylase family protein